MWQKTSPYHGLLTFGLILMVGLLSVGRSLWLSAQASAPTRAPSMARLDLAQARWYAQKGFSESDRSGFSPTAPGIRPVNRFPIHLNDLFAIAPGPTVNDFAIMTSFNLPPEAASHVLALSLAELGDNWAIYLNGVEIRREVFLGANGQILVHRSLQRVLILLPPKALRTGPNNLVIRLLGNAPAATFFSGWAPGLSMAQGYVVAPAAQLLQERLVQDAISWFQIGVYSFVGLIYLLLFLRQRERYALYFGAFLFACVIYSFAFSNLAFDAILDSAIVTRMMYMSNISSPGLVGLTLWSYLYPGRPASVGLRVLVAVAGAGCLAVWLVPFVWLDFVLNLYLFVILASVAYLIVLVFRAARRRVPDAHKILATGPFIFAMVLWAVADQLVLRTNIDLTGWIPFFLAVVFALIFVDRFWRLTMEVIESNRQLTLSRDHLEEQVEQRSAELRAANAELSAANQRLVQSGAQVQSALEEVRQLNADLEHRVEQRTLELRLAKEAAEGANRAKTAFLAIMGHELRTPLNAIFLAAEMLRQRGASQPEYRDFPEIILASGRRLLRMVEGVLEYATADAHPSSTALNVEAALRDVAARFELRAAKQGLQLEFRLRPGLPPICFDACQFDLVMRRLLENALRFTPEGGRVTVTAEKVGSWAFPQGDRPALRMVVADSGIGLRSEDCDRIFEPFVQLEASYLQHSEGAGLGLTLARRQVELQGGRLWAESEGLGKGSTFTVLLPAQAAASAILVAPGGEGWMRPA